MENGQEEQLFTYKPTTFGSLLSSFVLAHLIAIIEKRRTRVLPGGKGKLQA
jgi:hypothetical protein